MTTPTIETTMQRLHHAGLRMTLLPEDGLKATPASAVTTDLRALIVAHKVEIVAYLTDAANDTSPASSTVRLRAASLALDVVIAASGMAVNPDRWCYPHSDAMNTAEIDTFTARLALFDRQGLAPELAEALAVQLVERDRGMDSRRLCLECTHLIGTRCNNWQRAGVGIRSSDAQLAPEFMHLFQRCPGFTAAGGVTWV